MIHSIRPNAIHGLEKSFEQVEEKLNEFIEQDEEIKKKYDLITSIKGVGKVLAITLLVYTHSFQSIEDSKKLACYCKVAPLDLDNASASGPI